MTLHETELSAESQPPAGHLGVEEGTGALPGVLADRQLDRPDFVRLESRRAVLQRRLRHRQLRPVPVVPGNLVTCRVAV